MMLSCIAAVAIATVVGKKTFESYAYETSSLLMQNVEAMSSSNDNGGTLRACCREGGGTRGTYEYVCLPGTTFTTAPVGATAKSCTGPKQQPKLSLWQNNWGYCIEY